MALTEGDILPWVTTLLFDATNVRWPVSELRFWLNDGQFRIAGLKVDSCSAKRVITLVPGVWQTIPSDCWLLLDVISNVPASSNSIGKGVRLCQLETLNAYSPTWPTDPASATVDNYCYDERKPSNFIVYPPVNSTDTVNVAGYFAVYPTATTTGTDTLSIGDYYAPMLIDYILWRAFSKDAGIPNSMARAQMYMQSFNTGMQIQSKARLIESPNTSSEGGTPPKALRAM